MIRHSQTIAEQADVVSNASAILEYQARHERHSASRKDMEETAEKLKEVFETLRNLVSVAQDMEFFLARMANKTESDFL